MITALIVVMVVALYILPTVIALLACDERHTFCIMLINIFLGWTIILWIVALLWSILAPRRTP